ncbi:O-antigen ligase family protein [Winogradskyella luteola]|uniref:O-antigen ligase family protein n=1 Tax=Winogradskyella luteola TaxID=2828330 RepID=A0A9X1JS18_9FLAO|nr:O-antigen ligase family protein [Winogradskyella luteola]MBV7269167.1 O-antigen ligase family protein [Winogradskyella luteola]
MNRVNYIWKSLFGYLTLVLLSSILLDYFYSSLAFGFWFAFVVTWVVKTKQFYIDKSLLPFFIFTLFSFITIAWSVDKPQTMHAIGRQTPLFLLAIAGMFLPKLSNDIIKSIFDRFSVFVSGLSILLTILAIIKYYKYGFEGFLYYHELVSPLELNAIYVSYIVSFCFLHTLQNSTKTLLVKIIKLLVLGVFLIMLSSKMILFITIILSALIIIFKFKNTLYKLMAFGLILLAIILVLVFANPIKNRFISEFNSSYKEILKKRNFEKGRVYTGFEARLLQIRVFKEIMNTPKDYVLGMGLDASKRQIANTHRGLKTPTRFHTYNFHNQYLQVFAELGLIGLFLLSVSLALALKRALSAKYFLPFVFISMALFLSESVLWRQRGMLFFGTLYILLFIIDDNHESKKQI